MRQKPELRPPVESAIPVSITRGTSVERAAQISALGTLTPARTVAVQAEVVGLITQHSNALVPGGVVKANESLVKIDPRDYALTIRQRKAQLASAQVQLEQEQSRQAIAKREWALLGKDVTASQRGRRLALREPQIESAKAAIDAAKSSLDAARLALSRTEIKAPFNAVVRNEAVEIGQRVGPGQPLATLVGTDVWWLSVSIPIKALDWLKIPGSSAEISPMSDRATKVKRTGTLVRVLPEVEAGSQMARVLVEIDDPLGLKSDRPSLLLGATVQVRLEGKKLSNVLEIPRSALRKHSEVWLIDQKNQLVSRPVTVVWREQDTLLVRGIKSTDRIVSSALAGGTPGMQLRILESPPVQGAPETKATKAPSRAPSKQARAPKSAATGRPQ